MSRKHYPSDIGREQLEPIRDVLEGARKRTRPRKQDLYDIFCAILYLLKNAATWRALPGDFPDVRYEGSGEGAVIEVVFGLANPPLDSGPIWNPTSIKDQVASRNLETFAPLRTKIHPTLNVLGSTLPAARRCGSWP